jgi:hypothetical protein
MDERKLPKGAEMFVNQDFNDLVPGAEKMFDRILDRIEEKNEQGKTLSDLEEWVLETQHRLDGLEMGGASITDSVILQRDGTFEVKYQLGDD